jgi:hypothetical protein
LAEAPSVLCLSSVVEDSWCMEPAMGLHCGQRQRPTSNHWAIRLLNSSIDLWSRLAMCNEIVRNALVWQPPGMDYTKVLIHAATTLQVDCPFAWNRTVWSLAKTIKGI